jgi:hypothetical protein
MRRPGTLYCLLIHLTQSTYKSLHAAFCRVAECTIGNSCWLLPCRTLLWYVCHSAANSRHPILHYGAVNVPGTVLQNGLDTTKTVAASGRQVIEYRGPKPPQFLRLFRSVRIRLFNYEWLILQQGSGEIPATVPVQLSNRLEFDYVKFFNRTTGRAPPTSGFPALLLRSGFCVST